MSTQERRPRSSEMQGEKQPYPAKQSRMQRQPISDLSDYRPAGKLTGKIALITGGDSGIGRAVAIAYAMEGADVASKRNIRVNTVIPGPVWTPNIPGTMPIEEINNFGYETALERPGQPEELAPVYVMLASSDGSYMTGSQIEVTGGVMSSR